MRGPLAAIAALWGVLGAGACGEPCCGADDDCASGARCFEGFCALRCDDDAQCAEGERCAGGVCDVAADGNERCAYGTDG